MKLACMSNILLLGPSAVKYASSCMQLISFIQWNTLVGKIRKKNDIFTFHFSKNGEETKWRDATVDLLSGTIFVFDIDTQVYGQSRKQQMLQPQGVNTGICRMDTPSVAFLCTSNGWRQIYRQPASHYKLVWCCSGKQILIRRQTRNRSLSHQLRLWCYNSAPVDTTTVWIVVLHIYQDFLDVWLITHLQDAEQWWTTFILSHIDQK